MDYPHSVPNINLLAGKFTDGNPGTGVPPSLDPSAWANQVTDSILDVQTAGGLAPSEGDATQLLTAIQALIAQGAQRSFKNKIRNGALEIDQRNEGAAVALVSGTPKTIIDGWSCSYVSAAGGVTVQRVADAPVGFKNSLKVTVGVAAGGVVAADALRFTQTIEGQDLVDLGFGNAGALPVSLQGQFKASLAGVYSVALQNAAGNRSYVTTVAVAAPNVWTPWALPNIPGDLAGAWATDNTAGLLLIVTVAAGATAKTATLNAWQAAGTFAANTQTSAHLTTAGATFQFTAAQVEPNIVCTPFERSPIGEMIRRCQRQYNKSYSQGTAPATVTTVGQIATVSGSSAGNPEAFAAIYFPVEMRTAATMTYFSPVTGASGNWRAGAADITAANLTSPSTRATTVVNTASIGSNTQFQGHYVADAEFAAV